MTPLCTCHEVNWFARAPHEPYIQTSGCPIHDQHTDPPQAEKEEEK